MSRRPKGITELRFDNEDTRIQNDITVIVRTSVKRQQQSHIGNTIIENGVSSNVNPTPYPFPSEVRLCRATAGSGKVCSLVLATDCNLPWSRTTLLVVVVK